MSTGLGRGKLKLVKLRVKMTLCYILLVLSGWVNYAHLVAKGTILWILFIVALGNVSLIHIRLCKTVKVNVCSASAFERVYSKYPDKNLDTVPFKWAASLIISPFH